MLENIRLSLQGILSHKVRSILTMLGIIIGIAAIIAIVSTIKGTNEQIKNNLIGAGNNTVSVQLYQGDSPYDFTYQSAPTACRSSPRQCGTTSPHWTMWNRHPFTAHVPTATTYTIRTPSSAAPCSA